MLELVAILHGLDKKDRTQKNSTQQKDNQCLAPAELRAMHRQSHGEAAGYQHRGVDKLGVASYSAERESGVLARPRGHVKYTT